MVVGAPRAQTGQPDIIRGGAVLRCKINPHNLTGASAQFCQIIPFDARGKELSTLSFFHLSLFPCLELIESPSSFCSSVPPSVYSLENADFHIFFQTPPPPFPPLQPHAKKPLIVKTIIICKFTSTLSNIQV